MVVLHQHTEHRIVGNPVPIFAEKRAKPFTAFRLLVPVLREKRLKRRAQQRALQLLHLRVLHCASAQFLEQPRRDNLLEIHLGQIRNVLGRDGNRRRIKRH